MLARGVSRAGIAEGTLVSGWGELGEALPIVWLSHIKGRVCNSDI